MDSFSRPRHILSASDIPIWQHILIQRVQEVGLSISTHAYDNVYTGRIAQQDIERLRNLDHWYIWAIELGTDNNNLKDPKPKFLVRYPTFEEDMWKLGGAIAVGEIMKVVTIDFIKIYATLSAT